MSLTKTAVNKLLVAERKSMRQKQKNSAFMRKTLNIYNGMVKRAKENAAMFDLTLDDFRELVQSVIGTPCSYCQVTCLTLANFAADHAIPVSRGGKFGKANLVICCKSCNWQKGSLMWGEFLELVHLLQTLPTEAATDVKRRLTIGGKWSFKS